MSYEGRKRQLTIAALRWDLAQCEVRVDQDYPLLKIADTFDSRAFLEVIHTYSREDRLRYERARCKRNQPHPEITGERITREEEAFVKDILNQIGMVSRPNHLAWNNHVVKDPNPIKIPKVGSALVAGLKPLLGPARKISPVDWSFRTLLGNWYLETVLMLGRRHPYTVRILHQLLIGPDEAMPLGEGAPFALPQGWYVATEDDIGPVIESLVGISRYALDTSPAIASQVMDRTPYPYPENAKYLTSASRWSEEERARVLQVVENLKLPIPPEMEAGK